MTQFKKNIWKIILKRKVEDLFLKFLKAHDSINTTTQQTPRSQNVIYEGLEMPHTCFCNAHAVHFLILHLLFCNPFLHYFAEIPWNVKIAQPNKP